MTQYKVILTAFFAMTIISCTQQKKETNPDVIDAINTILEAISDTSQINTKDLFILQDCLNIYQGILVTAKELVTDSFYKARDFQNYETIKIDSSSSSTFNIKYRFKVMDTVTDFFMTIGTMISFEKSESAAQATLDLWEIGHRIGLSNSSAKDQQIEINDLDSILSFGVTSKFVEYRNKGYLRGYTLTGRTKNIAFLHSVGSNHIGHRDHIEILKDKINVLVDFANKYEK